MENNEKSAIGFGLCSYIVAFMSYYLLEIYYKFFYSYFENVYEIEFTSLLIFFWIVCIYAANHYRTKKIRKYWWVFLSLPILLGRMLEMLLAFFAWSISGFAP